MDISLILALMAYVVLSHIGEESVQIQIILEEDRATDCVNKLSQSEQRCLSNARGQTNRIKCITLALPSENETITDCIPSLDNTHLLRYYAFVVTLTHF